MNVHVQNFQKVRDMFCFIYIFEYVLKLLFKGLSVFRSRSNTDKEFLNTANLKVLTVRFKLPELTHREHQLITEELFTDNTL